MNLTLIAAIGKNNELGYNNKLIWHLKEDMKFFKENTIGKKILMGRKTLESLPKLLPGREHLVLTHQDVSIDGVKVFHSREELFEYLKTIDEEVMVIGGASIYKEFIDWSDKMLLTHIESSSEADAYFPVINSDEWNIEKLKESEEQGIKYKMLKYERKNK